MQIKYFLFVMWSILLLLFSACDNRHLKPSSSHFLKTLTVNSSRSIPTLEKTLHAIIVADTNDWKIGNSVEIDLENIQKLVKSVKQNTGLRLNQQTFYGNDFNYDNVVNAFDNLLVNRDDIIIFYYAGHGVNRGKGSQWPSMQLGKHLLDLDSITSTLKTKNPRFFIAMADTCNLFIDSPPTRGIEMMSALKPKTENYRQLFLNYRGHIIASSASPDQEAGGNSKNGGYFTKKFLNSLQNNLASTNPSWHTVMEKADSPIYFKDDEGNQQQQNPQSKINIVRVDASSIASQKNQLFLQVLPSRFFQIGDTMQIKVTNRSRNTGYLFVWDINSAGKITRFLPNEITRKHHLVAGKTITIPEHIYAGFSLTMTEPVGKGIVVAILVENRFKQKVLSENFELVSANQAQNALQKMRKQLNQLGLTNKPITSVEYEITR